MIAETVWDCLLNLDGVTMVIDERLGFWVKFVAREVQKTDAIPHGVSYSLTLHDRRGGACWVSTMRTALAGKGSSITGIARQPIWVGAMRSSRRKSCWRIFGGKWIGC